MPFKDRESFQHLLQFYTLLVNHNITIATTAELKLCKTKLLDQDSI